MNRVMIEEEVGRFRRLFVASRWTATAGPEADACLGRLNAIYRQQPGLFTTEDARFLNVLRGFLGVRMVAHRPPAAHTLKPRRRGDVLDHCWRCETPVDERFTEICPECDSKEYHWRVCPVCKACGCQRAGKVLV